MKGTSIKKILKKNHFSVEAIDENKKEDLDILTHMKIFKDFIDYSSRQKLIKTLEKAINLRIEATKIQQDNNGIGKIILGIRGIGKTYILQNISIYVGFNRSDLFVVYINSEFIKNESVNLFINKDIGYIS